MHCPRCRSNATTTRKPRTTLGYRRFHCRACGWRFNERTGTPLRSASGRPAVSVDVRDMRGNDKTEARQAAFLRGNRVGRTCWLIPTQVFASIAPEPAPDA